MRTTLRALMKRYPKEKCFATPRISLVDLSYEDKIEMMNNGPRNNTHIYFNVNDDRIYYATFIDYVKRRGNKFFITSVVAFDFEDILTRAVLPPAILAAKTPNESKTGKLNGEIIKVTP